MLFSVFIPTHNASGCIEATLKCVLSQSHQELELWLVDDCSTDNTVEILKQWQEKDPRVHIIAKEKNEGFVPFSWNQVFPNLKGEFTLYLSHDDLLSEDCIEQLVATQQQTESDCVIPEVRMWKALPEEVEIRDGSWTAHGHSCFDAKCREVNGKTAFAHMLNYGIAGFALWRTSLIRSIGMPTEAWNSDEGMQRIWALHCRKVAYCPKGKFYYRLNPGSITQGLKPYHVTGLKTQQRLLCAALSHGTLFGHPSLVGRFMWQYVKSYRYLKSQELLEVVRFGIVGVLATLLHYGIYLALIWVLPEMNASIAYSMGYIVSFVGNFLASNYYTFKTQPTVIKGIGFAFSHGVNYLLHILFLNLFLWVGLSETVAPIPVFCIVIPINFLLVRFVLKSKK